MTSSADITCPGSWGTLTLLTPYGAGKQNLATTGNTNGAARFTVPANAVAGDKYCFSCSVTGHCSSGNQSKHDRRVWMPQYSARPQRWECKKVTDGSISVSVSGSGSGSDNDNGNGNGNGCTVEVEGKDDEYVALAIKVEN